jgi:hypothetical protein
VRIFTSTLDLPYVKLMQAEMRRVDDYKSITEYILHFCEVAKAHLELAKRYSRTPMAANKKSSAVTPSPNTNATVRVGKLAANKDPDFNRGSYKPKEDSDGDRSGSPEPGWKNRRTSYSDNEDIADAAEGRDVHAWVETVPRRYGQYEHHTEQHSYDDEDY